MFDFFDKIIGYIEMAWDFLISIIESLLQLLVLTSTTVSLPLNLVGYLPSVLGVSVLVSVSVYVVKLIVGR